MASTINQVGYITNVDQLRFEASIIEKTIAPSYFNSEVSYIVPYRFESCNGLEYVEFTAAESIGASAFQNCEALQSVRFESEQTVGDCAFQNCTSLETVVFRSATTLGTDVFAGCTSLHEIEFGALTPMPASFSNSTIWTSVRFDAITTLPNARSNNFGTFLSKAKATLQSVYFNGVTGSIPSYYFSTFNALTTVEFQNASLQVASYAFVNCNNLKTIKVPNAHGAYHHAFSNCYNLESITLAGGDLGVNAFLNCSALSYVSLISTAVLGSGCFENCSSLKSFYAPYVATMSSSRHFANCTGLSWVKFDMMKTLVGNRSNNSNTVYLGATNIQYIDYRLVATIPSHYFSNYHSLQSVSFPAATVVSNYAFRYNNALTRVDLPKAQTLGTYAFQGCTSLSVAKFLWLSRINGNTFNGCTNLTKLYLLGSSMTILSGSTNNFTNAGITSTTGTIYVPESLLATYQANASWKNYSTRFSACSFSSFNTTVIDIPYHHTSEYYPPVFASANSATTIATLSAGDPIKVIGFSNGFNEVIVTSTGVQGFMWTTDITDTVPPD